MPAHWLSHRYLTHRPSHHTGGAPEAETVLPWVLPPTQQVWGKVSELLLPALGKLYRQFNPSNGAWGLKLVRPFGVILGKQEPEQFLALFLAGQQAQQDAMEFHLSAMIEKTDMSNAQKIGDSLVCPMIVDGKDPELMAHAIWHISLQKGAPLPDCGIYYIGLGRAVASTEEQRAILANPAGYALCTVTLSQGVQTDA